MRADSGTLYTGCRGYDLPQMSKRKTGSNSTVASSPGYLFLHLILY